MADSELERLRLEAEALRLRARAQVDAGVGQQNIVTPAANPDRQAMIDRIRAAKSGQGGPSPEALQRAATSDQTALDTMLLDSLPTGGGAMAKAVQGIPFAGEWMDEGFNYLDPGRGDRLRDIQGAMDRQRPGAALASELGGGLLGAVAMAPAVGKVPLPKSMVGKVAVGGGLGMLAGATEGAIAGAGRANDGDRIKGAFDGGMIGAGLGLTLGVGAPLVGKGAENLMLRMKKLDVRTIAETLGISPDAARVVKSYVVNDDLDSAARHIAALGDDAMLADAGPGTAQLLDTAQQTGGAALRISRDAVEERSARLGPKLAATLDNLLGGADGVKSAQKGISQRTAAVRTAAYNRAWQSPLDFGTGKPGEKVLQVLQRVPDEYLMPAIKTANRRAQMQADDTLQPILAQIGPDGKVVFSELPSVRQLHEIKVALDSIAETGTDAVTGKLSPDARDAREVANMLRNALKDASPAYARATKLGGDKIAEENALRMGTRLLSPKTTFEEAREILQGASAEAKLAAKRGLREQIENTLSNVRRTITDPNTDAREAMRLVSEMSSRANEKKVRLLLGTDSKALFDELEKAEAALALRAATSQNSATAIRLAGQKQIDAITQPGVVRRIAGNMGNPLDAAKEGTQALARIDPGSINERQRVILAEIAQSLVGTKGPDAERAIVVIRDALAGQPLKDADAALLNRLVTGNVAAGGYQSSTQYLEQ